MLIEYYNTHDAYSEPINQWINHCFLIEMQNYFLLINLLLIGLAIQRRINIHIYCKKPNVDLSWIPLKWPSTAGFQPNTNCTANEQKNLSSNLHICIEMNSHFDIDSGCIAITFQIEKHELKKSNQTNMNSINPINQHRIHTVRIALKSNEHVLLLLLLAAMVVVVVLF